jgi:hypothetical protein
MGNDINVIIANGTLEMKELAKRMVHMAPAEKAKAELILRTFQNIVEKRNPKAKREFRLGW